MESLLKLLPFWNRSTASESQISLRIMVDRKKNRVLFAEAGKDFVDVVLSFLTMPLGTIARLVSKNSNVNPVRFGCITSLYESVGSLDQKYLWTETCKEMLLRPRNPMADHCRNLKLNIDDTEPTKYFTCETFECRQEIGTLVSTFRNRKCKCGRNMSSEIERDSSITVGETYEGFVQGTANFVVFDDLTVMPGDGYTTLGLLASLGIEYAPEELTVNLTQNQVVDLLKCSLLSKAPLTDLFLHKTKDLNSKARESSLWIKEQAIDGENKVVKVKLTVTKSTGKILLAQVEKDFMDLLLSFLTFPLGAVECVLESNSCLGCIDKLHTSLVDLNPKYFQSVELKHMLINPKVAPQFKVKAQILPIDEVPHSRYSCCTTKFSNSKYSSYLSAASEYGGPCSVVNCGGTCRVKTPVTLLDPKAPVKGKSNNGGGFAKGPSMFMVTDDLVVKPFSFISASSFLNESNFANSVLEERTIGIGVKEVMCILKASMISSSALTSGLSPFLKKY